MNRGALVGITAVALAVLGLLVALWGSLFERVTDTVDLGPTEEARQDATFVLRTVLTRLGKPARRIETLDALPPAGTALVLGGDWSIGPGDPPRIERWVRDGGHLVVSLPGVNTDTDEALEPSARDLFDRLGVRVVYLPSPVTLRLPRTEPLRSVRLLFGLNRIDPAWSETYKPGMLFDAGYRHGKGSVSVVADRASFTNTCLEGRGNADRACYLVTWPGTATGAWLLSSRTTPGIVGALARRSIFGIISAALLLVAVLWRAAARFGPLLPPLDVPRRSLIEHVDAAGRFLYADRHGILLLRAAVRGLQRDLVRKRPAWARLDRSALADRLATLSTFEAGTIEQALSDTSPRDAASFTTRIQLIQGLRRAL